MKSFRLLTAMAAAAAVAITAAAWAAGTMNQHTSDQTETGHVLAAQWTEFEKARKADRPQKEAEILLGIRAEAMERHLPADFYDAGTEYIASVQRRNWKLRDSVRSEFAALVRDFDEPIVTYAWMGDFGNAPSDERMAYVLGAGTAFSGARHPAFYRTLGYLGGALKEFVQNDFEYALWDLLQRRQLSWEEPEKDEIYAALRAEIGSRYPAEPCLRYEAARNLPDEAKRKAALEAVAADPAARAVAFHAREDLLSMRFDSLGLHGGVSEDYKALRKECSRYLDEKAALTGAEARIANSCRRVRNLAMTLDGKGLTMDMEGDSVVIGFRNLSQARLTINKTTTTVVNPVRSYYATDTVKVPLPVLPDGNHIFEVKSGTYSAQYYYDRHTLSLAQRRTAEGIGVYVTDYQTGKPLEAAKILLRKQSGGSPVVSETIALDGFTLLPGRFGEAMKKNVWYALQAAYTDGDGRERLSPELSISGSAFTEQDVREPEGIRGNLYTDRGAYHPGDTLSFKAVLYKGDLTETVAVLPDAPVEIALQNAQGEEIGRKQLRSNEFGSVADLFVLPEGQRGGLFSLQLNFAGRPVGWRSVRVDAFVLPNFTLSFDPNEELYRAGDTVRVSGRAAAYSGHSLSGARVHARVLRFGELVSEEDLTLSGDRFALSFPARETGHYAIEVRVTDATGETQEAAASVYVADRIRILAEIGPAAEGECLLTDRLTRFPYGRERAVVMTGDRFHAVLTVNNGRGDKVAVPLEYVLADEAGRDVVSGRAASGDTVPIDLSACSSGLYVLKATARADRLEPAEETVRILLVRPGDTVLDAPVSRLFVSGPSDLRPGEKIRVQMGTADGEQWAVATLLGRRGEILSARKVHWEGERGKEGSLKTFEWDYPAGYPEAVRLQIFYFKHGEAVTYDREYRRVRTQLDLPLAFSSFTDRTLPGTEYTFTLKTLPDVEAVAAVYDKSLDAFGTNEWPTVSLRQFSPAYVPLHSVCGSVGPTFGPPAPARLAVAYGSRKLFRSVAMNADMGVMEDVALESAAVTYDAAPAGAPLMEEETVPAVRERFENALTFQPFLRSDADGNVSFRFLTSDRLSTYHVAVFAHDKAMRNALVLEETVVTVPVKVSVAEPAYLYLGDKYRIAVSVASQAGKNLEGGKVTLRLYDTQDWKSARPVQVREFEIPVLADGATAVAEFDIDADEIMAGRDGVLGIMASYDCGPVSDGIFLPVPVRPAVQRLTEAHSAVLLAGMDKEETLARLRAAFVNGSGEQADCREISVLDMVREALPSKAEPAAPDVLSLSEAWYVRLVAGSLGVSFDEAKTPTDKLLERILACRNDDGGFGWFEGMKSSPAITATLLERFAKVRPFLSAETAGALQEATRAAVKFLDRNQFDHVWPFWCGGLSTDQYLYVRSFYTDVLFEVSGSDSRFAERMKEFRKFVPAYLTPKKERGLSGQLFPKARRLRTLQNLLAAPSGIALAKAWGVSFSAESKLRKSLDADIVSLLEYAVDHRDGGIYYPNLVMPLRGLLESEAYAHSLLCDLFAGLASDSAQGDRLEAVADGIRLWLMLQKETQHWDEDPAFVDAVHSVLQGSEAVKATKVLVMEQTFENPFSEIRAAGNGFTVVRKFFRSVGVEEKYNDRTEEQNRIMTEWEEIRPGTVLRVGDRIAAEYRIWNAENRSFVRLSAPREASLVPVQQLSGPYGGSVRPLRISGAYLFQPQGYREVHADRTDYYFDTCPEESTVVREEFFVTRAGAFQAPVLSIESLYAPHYRANDGWTAPLVSSTE